MAEVKGSLKRLVESPGYHIRPRYDMSYWRAKISDSGGGESSGEHLLPLAPMVDMFSMLVVFLIINFTSTGEIFFVKMDGKLPLASHGRDIESLPVISVTKNAVIFDMEKVADNPLHLEEKDQELPRLRETLRKIHALDDSMKLKRPFKGAVNIQADESTPIIYVKRVMNALISEGWTGINFAVRPGNDSKK